MSTELFTKDAGLGWIAKFQKWYQDRPGEFLLYDTPLESFVMWGGWRLNEPAMWDAVPRADADLGWREPGATPLASPVTEADVDAALARMGAAKPPRERGALFLLNHEKHGLLCESRDRINRKTPILCRCCGEPFRVPSAQHFANCPACRSAGRKRCLDCNEVFTPLSNKVKRCTACLTREAEWKARRKRH